MNEVFLRVTFTHRLVPGINSSTAVAMTHFAVIVVFAGLIAYFNTMPLTRSRGPAETS
ncbi:MAG TPA: hypothetical protein VKC66_17880 [Xanthobacteraceae bacterium]|nr:hypothetical protein [Xanthobacteraceae bacterium]